MGVGFQLCHLQNAIHFLPHGSISLTEAKLGETQLFNTVCILLEDDLDQVENKELGELPP
jgi:hypothetical protein